MKATELAQICGCKLEGPGDIEISDVAAIEKAAREHVVLAGAPEYAALLEKSKAGAAIVKGKLPVPQGMTALRHDDPDIAFSKAIAALRPAPLQPLPGISDKAVLGKRLDKGDDVSIGAYCVLGDGVKLGRNVVLYPHVVLGDNVEIGDHTVLYPHVTVLERCKVGKRCVLWPGAVIGGDGFGFHFIGGKFEKAPQRGIVVLEDDVEIGANTTVDRARFDVTLIRKGTKVDNLVQIAHNCIIGQNCAIAGQTGLSGSVVLKDYVILAGGVGVADHVTIGMGAKVGAGSGVMKDIEPGKNMVGYPVDEGRSYMKREAAVRRLPETMERVRAIEKQVRELRKAAGLPEDPDAQG